MLFILKRVLKGVQTQTDVAFDRATGMRSGWLRGRICGRSAGCGRAFGALAKADLRDVSKPVSWGGCAAMLRPACQTNV